MGSKISSEVLSSYYAGELDRIEILYTSFVSMISFLPSIRTIIPLTPTGIETEGDEIFKMTTKDGSLQIDKTPVEKAAPAAERHPPALPQRPAPPLPAGLRRLRARLAHVRHAGRHGQRQGPPNQPRA